MKKRLTQYQVVIVNLDPTISLDKLSKDEIKKIKEVIRESFVD